MKCYDFSVQSDRETLKKELFEHFRRKNFVPFFGSGFSKGLPASRGLVPSVDELKSEIIKIIVEVEGYEDEEIEELKHENLANLSEHFWASLENPKADAQKSSFLKYMEEHFTNIHDLPISHRNLVNCTWRYLYTLNYDDAIERASDIRLVQVYPYAPHSRWLNDKKCLYKIHGDIDMYLKTGDNKYCILSTQQYLQALQDEMNQDMLGKLEADFSGNNLIFFGCSLVDELDMLFTAGTKFSRQKTLNSDTHSYYVRHVGANSPPLTRIREKRFEQFAITDIINVNSSDVDQFYSYISSISHEAELLQEKDDLSDYIGFTFTSLSSANPEKNIEYLFYSSRINPNKINKTSLFHHSLFVGM